MSWLILVASIAFQGVQVDPVQHELDVFVKVRPGTSVGVDQDDRWVFADELGAHVLLPQQGIHFAGPAGMTSAANQEVAQAIGVDRWIQIQLAPGADRKGMLAALRALPQVEHAELDALGGLAEVPDDTLFPLQWSLQNTGQNVAGSAGTPGSDVNVVGAWDITTGGSSVIVATLDSGANPHVDLGDRVLPGRNIPNDTDNALDVCVSHGTHVAGIIAAQGNNAAGIAGMCWDAQILPVVIVDPCSGQESWVADGLVWAVDNGADIVNMSLQYTAGTQYLYDAVLYAFALDVPMIAATGNSNSSTIAYPALWDEVIAVGAISNDDTRWSGSNFGPQIDLVAPGHEIQSTQLFAAYGTKSGTSFAAPHVSGAAALLLSIEPDLGSEDIRDILNGTARDISLVGFDDGTGNGCLDVQAALEVLVPPGPNADFNGDGRVDGDDLLQVLSFWGICEGCVQDLDGNGLVEGNDLLIVLSQWTE